MKNNISILKRIGYSNIIVVLMQLCMYPYLFFYFFGGPSHTEVAVVFFVIILLFCIGKSNKRRRVHSAIASIMIIQSIVWLLYFVNYNDTSYLVRIFFISLTYLALLLLQKDDSVVSFSRLYSYIIAIQGVLGVLAFILIFASIISPIATMSFNDYGDSYEFYGITFVKVHIGNFARINGFFDEPGAFAFWGMFALIFNKLFFDNRKLEIIIIISLLVTFSSAYFILLPIYFLWFYGNRIKSMLLLLIVLAPLLFFSAKFLSSNEGFLKYTVERFQGGEIESTRFDQAEYTKKIFVKSPIFGIGAENLDGTFGTMSSDNPYEILAKDGIFGLIITYLPLFYIAIRFGRRKDILGPIIILSLNYMQRPFHINEMHYFMLYLFCFLVLLKYERGANETLRASNLLLTNK